MQEDGTLDPRYHKFFQTSWTCNKDKGQAWSESQAKLFEKNIESPEISTMQINENLDGIKVPPARLSAI